MSLVEKTEGISVGGLLPLQIRTVVFSLLFCGVLFVTFVVVAMKTGATHLKLDHEPMSHHEDCEKHTVLVTGFERFANSSFENPSKVAAVSLNGTCGRHYCASSLILSVDSAGVQLPATHLAKVAAVLHLGLEDVSKGLRLEIAAKNLAGNASNVWSFDVDCSPTTAAVPDASCLEVTTAPLDRMVLESLGADGTRELWSRDPGAYFCNEVYFRTLYAIRSQRVTVPSLRCSPRPAAVTPALVPALFVHLPSPNTMQLADYLPVLTEILDILGEPPLVGVPLPVEDIGRR